MSRAVAVRALRKASVLTREQALRWAIVSGDERLDHTWARLLLDAGFSSTSPFCTDLRVESGRAAIAAAVLAFLAKPREALR